MPFSERIKYFHWSKWRWQNVKNACKSNCWYVYIKIILTYWSSKPYLHTFSISKKETPIENVFYSMCYPNVLWAMMLSAVTGIYRRFRGSRRHFSNRANTAKFTVNVWEKIVILMLDNSRKVDILQFLWITN